MSIETVASLDRTLYGILDVMRYHVGLVLSLLRYLIGKGFAKILIVRLDCAH